MNRNLFMSYIHYFVLFTVIQAANHISIIAIKGEAAVAIAIVWMTLTLAVYFLFMRKKISRMAMTLYSIINAVIGGIAISAYYQMKNVAPFIPALLIVIFGIMLFTNYCLLYIVKTKRVFTLLNLSFAILLLIVSFYIWLEKNQSLGSSMFFLGVAYLCFSYALHRVSKKGLGWNSIIPLSSLLMFGGLLLVVIVAITDGEALDAMDAGFLEGTGKKKNQSIM